jgi:hypothetical protein
VPGRKTDVHDPEWQADLSPRAAESELRPPPGAAGRYYQKVWMT